MNLPGRALQIKEALQSACFRWSYDWEHSASARHIVILFFNGLWGEPPDYPKDKLPPDCEITTDKRRMREAAAVVFHIPSLGSLRRMRKFPGQKWVAWSMECEVHYPQLRNPDYMRLFDWTMTYDRDADITVPYYSPDLLPLLSRAPQRHDQLVSFFASGRHDRSGRLAYAAELMRHAEVHSYGRRLRNRTLARDLGHATKIDTIGAYQFTLAFENAIARDYVTEKFFDPLIVGSVPVYLGAPNVAELAPGEHCYIDAAEFPDPRGLAEYLLALDADPVRYQEYLNWKQAPLRPEFLALVEQQRIHPFVRLCEKLREARAANRSNRRCASG